MTRLLLILATLLATNAACDPAPRRPAPPGTALAGVSPAPAAAPAAAGATDEAGDARGTADGAEDAPGKKGPATPDAHVTPPAHPGRTYPWPREAAYAPLARRFPAPPGATRLAATEGSWPHWLRHLPLLPAGRPVLAHDGETILEGDDHRLAAVLDLDVVRGDLQQCVDSILRLRAEYLRVAGRDDEIAFRYTNGWTSPWSPWKQGYRPRLVDPRTVELHRIAPPADDRETFVKYLRDLFSYAGTVSVAREAKPVATEDLAIGDFFILPGGPGHAVLVVDLARNATGTRYALLAQGFMPAQQMHVLRGPQGGWWELDEDEAVATPFWKPFPWDALRRL